MASEWPIWSDLPEAEDAEVAPCRGQLREGIDNADTGPLTVVTTEEAVISHEMYEAGRKAIALQKAGEELAEAAERMHSMIVRNDLCSCIGDLPCSSAKTLAAYRRAAGGGA